MASMKRDTSCPLDAFLLLSDDPRIHQAREEPVKGVTMRWVEGSNGLQELIGLSRLLFRQWDGVARGVPATTAKCHPKAAPGHLDRI